MKFLLFSATIALFASGVATFLHQAAAPTPRARWEYQVVVLTGDPDEQVPYVNRYGTDGWELVQIMQNDRRAFWVFKRQSSAR